ncbi:MAG TPA: pentapeptide repeat-containing protein [Nostocaceae cyanobacterium]|nr:pentapeptide repeat-containing protein [Nostocaceae cyanobacterium]
MNGDKNLKGRSYRGKNLKGQDFSYADIRSCNFSEAILEGANFQGVIAGVSPKQKFKLIAIAIALAGVAGLTAAFAAGIFFISFFRSLGYATITIALVITAVFALSTRTYGYVALASAVAITIAIAGAGVGAFAGASMGALTIALILIVGGIGAATGAGIYAVIGNWSILIAGFGSLIGSIIIAIAFKDVLAGIMAITAAGAVEILAGYVAHSALNGNEKLAIIRTRAISFSSWGGTSFYKADLSRANFSNSKLEKTDLRFASVFQTNFEGVVGIDYARLEGTILENPSVRELCVTRNGRRKDYTDMNLNGAYLQGVKMEGATLVRTQVLGADFTDASLTGVCIQEWNFNSETIFDHVDCKMIFIKSDSQGNFYEPKPDSGYFENGQFSKWIQEVKDTVDLIFDKGLNWKAFAFSLVKSAIDNNEGDLSIKSIENKGDNFWVAKIAVPEGVNKETIHQSLIENYEIAIAKIKCKHQLEITAKNERIYTLERILESHIAQLMASVGHEISIHGEGNKVYLVDKKGQFMSVESHQNRNINVKGDFSLQQTGSTFNLGDIEGSITNTVQELKESNQPEAANLADLISQLQKAIQDEASLTDEQKKDALEALETIGEEAQKLPENRIQKVCKFALNSLKALTPVVTATGQLSTALKECLPLIGNMMGL